jgi:hypothetical protein
MIWINTGNLDTDVLSEKLNKPLGRVDRALTSVLRRTYLYRPTALPLDLSTYLNFLSHEIHIRHLQRRRLRRAQPAKRTQPDERGEPVICTAQKCANLRCGGNRHSCFSLADTGQREVGGRIKRDGPISDGSTDGRAHIVEASLNRRGL